MIEQGKYKVYFNPTATAGTSHPEEMGGFVVENNSITNVWGTFVKSIIQTGPISRLEEHRILVSLNNGYYSTTKVE